MSLSKQFAAFVLAATCTTTMFAGSHCPGNVESLPYRSLNRHQIVIPVRINHSGPYNFLLDTGTNITMIDPALARDLHLTRYGEASISSVVGAGASGKLARVDLVETGTHQVAGLRVVVWDLRIEQGKTQDVRGILGEDFLKQFDLLIDNAHSVVCLDDSGMMRSEIRGPHLELLSPAGNESPRPLVIEVRLTDTMKPVLLKLDSGADVCLLFSGSLINSRRWNGELLTGHGATADPLTFRPLPPQDMKIGSVGIAEVPFIAFWSAPKEFQTVGYDGLLSLGLFRRVFISDSHGFAVLER